MLMPGRNQQSEEYRYGFNGMERDDEVSGEGNQYGADYRQYDSRLARWTSVDPLAALRPFESPYAGFGNNPIYFVDPSGLTPTTGGGGGGPIFGIYTLGALFDGINSALQAYNNLPVIVLPEAIITPQEESPINWSRQWGGETLEQTRARIAKERNDERLVHEGLSGFHGLNSEGLSAGSAMSYSIDYGAQFYSYENMSFLGHTALDGLGMIPLVGEVADGVNAIWYGIEGDYKSAAFSLGAMIPFVGWASTGTKYAVKAVNYTGEIIYKGSNTLTEAVFKLKDGRTVGFLAEATENGKKLTLDNVTFYGKNADGTAMGASDLGAKELIELRTSVNAWAKESGFESINYKGTRVANSSSKNPGMKIDWNIILNK